MPRPRSLNPDSVSSARVGQGYPASMASASIEGYRRSNLLRRLVERLRFRRALRRCGDFLLEDPPPDAFVREPRRPRPLAPGGAIALELPPSEHLF